LTAPSNLREEERQELLLRAYLEMQREQQERGALPPSGRNVLTRFRRVFECLGAIQIGLLIACFTIFMNFLIIVMLLHLDMSRYLTFLSFM
jgi:hypothetical protein